MHLKHIEFDLARNPGDEEHPLGARGIRYVMTAPLTVDGHLDEGLWKANKDKCVFTHFEDDKEQQRGRLAHARGKWRLRYDGHDGDDDETIPRLASHQLIEGEYLTIVEPDGDERTFQIVRIWNGPKAVQP